MSMHRCRDVGRGRKLYVYTWTIIIGIESGLHSYKRFAIFFPPDPHDLSYTNYLISMPC